VSDVQNLSTLVTILFGLMLADLFASIHRLIRGRRRIRWHWIPIALTWYVLITILKNWWEMLSGGAGTQWESGWAFIFYAHVLLILYLVASAVLPDEVPEDGLDLKEFYFDTRGYFWGLLACLNLVMLVFALLRPVLFDSPINWMAALSNFVMGAFVLSLAWIRRYAYHVVLILLFLALMMFEVVGKF